MDRADSMSFWSFLGVMFPVFLLGRYLQPLVRIYLDYSRLSMAIYADKVHNRSNLSDDSR